MNKLRIYFIVAISLKLEYNNARNDVRPIPKKSLVSSTVRRDQRIKPYAISIDQSWRILLPPLPPQTLVFSETPGVDWPGLVECIKAFFKNDYVLEFGQIVARQFVKQLQCGEDVRG